MILLRAQRDGSCQRVSVLTQFGIGKEQVHGAWEGLAASLPDAR